MHSERAGVALWEVLPVLFQLDQQNCADSALVGRSNAIHCGVKYWSSKTARTLVWSVMMQHVEVTPAPAGMFAYTASFGPSIQLHERIV